MLFEKIGLGPHSCEWCEKLVDWMPGDRDSPKALVADHLDWNIHNNAPANLVPSCRVCNAHRVEGGGRAPIEESELFVVNANGSRSRAVNRDCLICGSAFIARISQVKVGKGLYCSRSCARRGPRVTSS